MPGSRRPCPRRTRDRFPAAAGFSLLELMIALSVVSVMLAMGVPAYQKFLTTQRLQGSAQNLAMQVRLARDQAMTTGIDQPLHFYEDSWDADFHVHQGAVSRRWSFPPGIHYASGSMDRVTMRKDGSADASGYVVIRDDRGRRDTLSVLASGIVLVR